MMSGKHYQILNITSRTTGAFTIEDIVDAIHKLEMTVIEQS